MALVANQSDPGSTPKRETLQGNLPKAVLHGKALTLRSVDFLHGLVQNKLYPSSQAETGRVTIENFSHTLL
ncbi:hypothetical protein N431DRAFT_429601 [Stipitochalara longipes BDJ]|nr:hypothetical protein N431DRAFT_429601 [Stipitochalara longipes BDJ]